MKKYIYPSLALIALSIIIAGVQTARANPYVSATGISTAPATTTVNYMTPGTATTTLTYDAFLVGTQTISTTKASYAALLVQFAGSSSPNSVLRANVEYSDDAVDWYQDGGSTFNFSTTTKPYDISQAAYFNYVFSSTTAGLAATPNATSTRAVILNTPLRYTRVVFSLPIGSQNGAVWARIVPTKERSE